MITKVNEFKLAEFTYASCFDEVNEILVKESKYVMMKYMKIHG